jgi:histidyl-tRNA synthetase
MNDILPEEARSWHRVEASFRGVAELFGYGEVRTPIIEDTALFSKQIGETSDVVEKEMYSFRRHDNELTVRPEGTAGAARAYVEHAMWGKESVSRWYYVGAMFRGERPAKGRYRQFHQAGCELYGDAGPVADAEMIELCVRVLASLSITDIKVHLNSLGSGPSSEGEANVGTRARYKAALLDYLLPRSSELSEDSQRRLEKNPLRILDSKDPRDQAIAKDAPSILDVLSTEDSEHFSGVQRSLTALGIPFVVDPTTTRAPSSRSKRREQTLARKARCAVGVATTTWSRVSADPKHRRSASLWVSNDCSSRIAPRLALPVNRPSNLWFTSRV